MSAKRASESAASESTSAGLPHESAQSALWRVCLPERRRLRRRRSLCSNCSFFPAVEIKDVESERSMFTSQSWERWIDDNFANDRKAAILGCFGSTVRILESYSRSATIPPAVLVIEDDVRANPLALSAVHEFAFSGRFNRSWDVVRFYVHELETYRSSRKSVMNHFGDRELVQRYRSAVLGHDVFCFVSKYGDWGTQAVLYKGSSIGRVEAYLKSARLADIDKMIARSANATTNALRSLICVTPASEKPVFEHNTWDFDTDIPKTMLLSSLPNVSLAARRPWNGLGVPTEVNCDSTFLSRG